MSATDEVRGRIAALIGATSAQADADASTPAFFASLRSAKRELCDLYAAGGCSVTASRLLTLKTLNLIVSRRDFARRARRVVGRPLGLIVDPSNGCNLGCPGCVHSDNLKRKKIFDWSPAMIEPGRMEGFLAAYAPWATSIFFFDYGEPLLNPKTPHYIRKAKQQLVRTTISSNLSLKKLDAEALVASGLDHLTLSIDGATQQTYETYRRGGDLALVLDNLDAIVAAKKKLGFRTPILNWQYLVFAHNEHEIEAATELARSHGANQITLGAPFDVTWDDPSIVLGSRTQHEWVVFDYEASYLLENTRRFEPELDVVGAERRFEAAWQDDAFAADCDEQAGPRSDAVCHWLYKNLAMDAKGRVMPCCAPPGRDYDLVYADFDADAADGPDPGAGSGDIFNTPKFQLARLGFQDPEAADREGRAMGLEKKPHCAECIWAQGEESVNIKPAEAAGHLAEASGGLLDPESLGLLGGW